VRTIRPFFPQLNGDDALAALEIQTQAHEELSRCLSRVGNPDVDVFLDAGVPHVRIIERATQIGADLIVVAGPEGSPPSRGVAEHIARYARIPVLIARSSPNGPVLTATDFSEASGPAVRAAARQAKALDLPLVALHVVDVEQELAWLSALRKITGSTSAAYAARLKELVDEAGSQLATELAELAPGAKGEVRQGHAAETIATRAKEMDASLLVVGTHGRTGLDRVLVGSIAESVIRQAPCSVLVIPSAPPNGQTQ
jgi:universal stress protein A